LDIIVFFNSLKLSKTITYLNTIVKAAVSDLNAGNHDMMNILGNAKESGSGVLTLERRMG